MCITKFKDREDLHDLKVKIHKKFNGLLDENFLSKIRLTKGPEISTFQLVNSHKLNCLSNNESVLTYLNSIIDDIWIGLKSITDFNMEEFKARQRKDVEHKAITLERIEEKIHLAKKVLRSADELTDDIRKYIEYLQSLVNEKSPIDNKPVSKYYVESRAALVPTGTWDEVDDKIEDNYSEQTQKISKLTNDFLDRNDDWYLVIGTSYGMGKTTMAKMISDKYAKIYLNAGSGVNTEAKIESYLPVLVFLRNGFSNVYHRNNLGYLLEKIIYAHSESSKRHVLLILDALDEYEDGTTKPLQDKIAALMVQLEKWHSCFENMKVIITSRVLPTSPISHLGHGNIPMVLNIQNGNYVRLFTFSPEQKREFFEKYKLNMNDIPNLDFPVQINKPIFWWMVALMVSNPNYMITFKEEWSERMKISLVFLNFMHLTLMGKHKGTISVDDWESSYIAEKKILRRIAALKQIYKENLSYEMVESEIDAIQPRISFQDLNKIITSYYYFRTGPSGRGIEFIHETFKEYLLAEYYIEKLIEGDRAYRLNTRVPSFDTIQFLEGLLGLMAGSKTEDSIAKLISKDRASLLVSFGYSKDIDNALEDLKRSALKWVENENIVFVGKGSDVTRSHNEEIWTDVVVTTDDFEDLWLQRWISLFVLNTLDPNVKPSKEKLAGLIRNSINNIPFYLRKLNGVDLSDTDLTNANFGGANLSNVNFQRTNLLNSRMVGADLSGANLSRSNVSFADLSGALVKDAILTKANLEGSVLFQANLSNADLSGSRLVMANLYSANLSGSLLIGLNIRTQIPRGASIEMTVGTYRHLIPIDPIYPYVFIHDTYFNDSVIDDKEDEEYFRQSGGKNVPRTVTDKAELVTNLRQRNLHEERITEVLSYSTLS